MKPETRPENEFLIKPNRADYYLTDKIHKIYMGSTKVDKIKIGYREIIQLMTTLGLIQF